MNIGGVVFPLEQRSRDQASVVYQAQYDTEGVPHTKSGDRQPVQVSIEVGQQHAHIPTHAGNIVSGRNLPAQIQMFGCCPQADTVLGQGPRGDETLVSVSSKGVETSHMAAGP